MFSVEEYFVILLDHKWVLDTADDTQKLKYGTTKLTLVYLNIRRFCDSSVGIVTRYGLNGPGI